MQQRQAVLTAPAAQVAVMLLQPQHAGAATTALAQGWSWAEVLLGSWQQQAATLGACPWLLWCCRCGSSSGSMIGILQASCSTLRVSKQAIYAQAH